MEMGLLDHVEQRGKLEGKLEGMLEGQRELPRFGPLPSSAVTRLHAVPSDRLTELGCALLSATSLDELGLGDSATDGD